MVLLNEADLSQGVGVAERMRAGIEAMEMQHEQDSLSVTASFGVAQWDGSESLDQILARADRGVYLAKDRGRNRVEPVQAGVRERSQV